MKEINFLPQEKRFSYKQYIIKKGVIAAFILNIVFLILVFSINSYINAKLKQCILQRKDYINRLSSIDSKLTQYSNNYKVLLRKLSKLKKEEVRLKSLVFVRRSAFSSTIIYLNTFTKGINFESVSYNNGYFKFKGITDTLKDFQRFYYMLEKNISIKSLKLYSVKRKEQVYEFEISYEVSF
ncbi:hypothetical protein [Hippea maritima]|uniref:Fimbrial assembly family protein n=1 Tax=Hippea maritima (strain ATCC 700847 / DSM 10411 / MH2) TaxID=760142 RepID=F2LWJ7_HIPMA|nr:hypothetical protein [Hippea maritima]AEA34106.1 hypothetical protein Hipma_1140 [Hippea maritima DSM 10411]